MTNLRDKLRDYDRAKAERATEEKYIEAAIPIVENAIAALPVANQAISIDQRVRLSPLGIKCLWHTKLDRASFRGSIKASYGDGSCVKVKWDHLKSASMYSRDFVELDDGARE